MARSAKPIPEGFHTVTPHLVVKNGAQAIEFYKKALGAEERTSMKSPDGKIVHAELKIGDSVIFLADEMPGATAHGPKSPQTVGACTTTLHLYVPDVDTAFRRAIQAGGTETMPVEDQFWGDRFGTFTDPFGHSWGIATHKEDLSRKELEDRAQQFFANMQRKTA